MQSCVSNALDFLSISTRKKVKIKIKMYLSIGLTFYFVALFPKKSLYVYTIRASDLLLFLFLFLCVVCCFVQEVRDTSKHLSFLRSPPPAAAAAASLLCGIAVAGLMPTDWREPWRRYRRTSRTLVGCTRSRGGSSVGLNK